MAHALPRFAQHRVGMHMPIDVTPSVHDVREALRRYLRERPNAADTLTGIAQWWLPESIRGISIERLQAAIADLIAANEVRCTILPDGTQLYARAGGAPSDADESDI
jgi:hypothetical protein